jgi:hypothetical protein
VIWLIFVGGKRPALNRSDAKYLEGAVSDELASDLFGFGTASLSAGGNGKPARLVSGDILE